MDGGVEFPIFGPLDQGADSCRPEAGPAAYAAVPFRYRVVFTEPTDAAVRQVFEIAHFGILYRSTGIVEVAGSPDIVERLAAIEGVHVVVAPMAIADEVQTIAAGIDYLAARADTERVTRYRGPFVDPDGALLGYPVTRIVDGRRQVQFDASLATPLEPPLMPVISMSLGTTALDYPSVPDDLVNLITAGISDRILTVAAAGNCGEIAGRETVSAWAQPAWVLAVGASDDEAGTRLADYSSRGVPGDPTSGPDLVAYGRSAVPNYPEGTSFAAPRVTGLALICAAALLQLRHASRAHLGLDEGIPVVGAGMIDTFGDEIWDPPKGAEELPALPLAGPDRESVTRAVEMAAAEGITVDVQVPPPLLRALLIGACRPMPGYEPHQVGSGFIDLSGVLRLLGSLSGAELVGWFGDRPMSPELPEPPCRSTTLRTRRSGMAGHGGLRQPPPVALRLEGTPRRMVPVRPRRARRPP